MPPVSLSMSVEGLDKLHDKLARISPRKNGSAWVRRALITCAERVQTIAAKEMIIQGSRFRGPAGKRGGKGKMMDAAVDARRLTSRHGGSGLVGSIRVNRSPLPMAIEVGSDKKYAAIHEEGGTINVTDKMRRALHYKGMHLRKGTKKITMPKRPYLAPALEKASKEFTRIFAKELGRELAK
jgi:phage gpG-like protein